MTQEDNTAIQQEAPALPDTVAINDLDSFVRVLMAWHGNKVAVVNHMKSIPEGTEVEVGDVTHVLTGEYLEGFKLGLAVALHELGTLPFVAETESPAEEAASKAADAAIEAAKS